MASHQSFDEHPSTKKGSRDNTGTVRLYCGAQTSFVIWPSLISSFSSLPWMGP